MSYMKTELLNALFTGSVTKNEKLNRLKQIRKEIKEKEKEKILGDKPYLLDISNSLKRQITCESKPLSNGIKGNKVISKYSNNKQSCPKEKQKMLLSSMKSLKFDKDKAILIYKYENTSSNIKQENNRNRIEKTNVVTREREKVSEKEKDEYYIVDKENNHGKMRQYHELGIGSRDKAIKEKITNDDLDMIKEDFNSIKKEKFHFKDHNNYNSIIQTSKDNYYSNLLNQNLNQIEEMQIYEFNMTDNDNNFQQQVYNNTSNTRHQKINKHISHFHSIAHKNMILNSNSECEDKNLLNDHELENHFKIKENNEGYLGSKFSTGNGGSFSSNAISVNNAVTVMPFLQKQAIENLQNQRKTAASSFNSNIIDLDPEKEVSNKDLNEYNNGEVDINTLIITNQNNLKPNILIRDNLINKNKIYSTNNYFINNNNTSGNSHYKHYNISNARATQDIKQKSNKLKHQLSSKNKSNNTIELITNNENQEIKNTHHIQNTVNLNLNSETNSHNNYISSETERNKPSALMKERNTENNHIYSNNDEFLENHISTHNIINTDGLGVSKHSNSATNQLVKQNYLNELNNYSQRINMSINKSKIIQNRSKSANSSHSKKYCYTVSDINHLQYELIKHFDQVKYSNHEFLHRMMFDIYKRQTKEERFNKFIESNKVCASEIDRLETFNRLINDANRRIYAQNNLQVLKNEVNEEEIVLNKKSYSTREWQDIYKGRFESFNIKKQSKLIKKRNETKKQKIEEDMNIINENQKITKKASSNTIQKSGRRMYEVAEKYKFRLENKKKEIESLYTFHSNRSKNNKRICSPATSTSVNSNNFKNKELDVLISSNTPNKSKNSRLIFANNSKQNNQIKRMLTNFKDPEFFANVKSTSNKCNIILFKFNI